MAGRFFTELTIGGRISSSGALPSTASPDLSAGNPARDSDWLKKPVTTVVLEIASASSLSPSGKPESRRSASDRSAPSSLPSRDTRFAGVFGSGSENTISKTTTAAPSSRNRSTICAMRERGQGHCPYLAIASSSISMMRMGCPRGSRGFIR